MSDLIRREDAIDALKKYEELESNNFSDTSPICMMTVATIANCIEEIVTLPSAEPERTAKVKVLYRDESVIFGHCECGQAVNTYGTYCHKCGARLEWK